MNIKYNYGDSILLDSFFNESVAKTIREIRQQKNMSYAELSNKMNNKVSRQTLCHYELNDTKIRIDTFKEIVVALEMTPKELFDKINYNYFNEISNYSRKL